MAGMDRDAAVTQAMAENLLEPGYRAFVLSYLARSDDGWRRCCNSSCEPCILQIGRVVDRARALMAPPDDRETPGGR